MTDELVVTDKLRCGDRDCDSVDEPVTERVETCVSLNVADAVVVVEEVSEWESVAEIDKTSVMDRDSVLESVRVLEMVRTSESEAVCVLLMDNE